MDQKLTWSLLTLNVLLFRRRERAIVLPFINPVGIRALIAKSSACHRDHEVFFGADLVVYILGPWRRYQPSASFFAVMQLRL